MWGDLGRIVVFGGDLGRCRGVYRCLGVIGVRLGEWRGRVKVGCVCIDVLGVI